MGTTVEYSYVTTATLQNVKSSLVKRFCAPLKLWVASQQLINIVILGCFWGLKCLLFENDIISFRLKGWLSLNLAQSHGHNFVYNDVFCAKKQNNYRTKQRRREIPRSKCPIKLRKTSRMWNHGFNHGKNCLNLFSSMNHVYILTKLWRCPPFFPSSIAVVHLIPDYTKYIKKC